MVEGQGKKKICRSLISSCIDFERSKWSHGERERERKKRSKAERRTAWVGERVSERRRGCIVALKEQPSEHEDSISCQGDSGTLARVLPAGSPKIASFFFHIHPSPSLPLFLSHFCLSLLSFFSYEPASLLSSCSFLSPHPPRAHLPSTLHSSFVIIATPPPTSLPPHLQMRPFSLFPT